MAGSRLERANLTLRGAGGVPLAAWRWHDPARTRKATVVLVHGYAEHLGRYTHVIEALCRAGYAVVGMDLRGHGHSGGRRAAVRRFDAFVDDLDLLIEQEVRGDSPVFLLGQSMGGLIATRCALRRTDQAGLAGLAGLVVSGAAFKVGGDLSGIQRWAGALLARVLPYLPVVPAPSPGMLSRDPEVGRRFVADPLTYTGRVRAAMAYGIFAAGEETRARAAALTLPLLVLHGADDTLTDPAGSIAVYRAAASADKTLKLLPGLLHEIFNEPEGPAVIAEVVSWLDARAAGADVAHEPPR